MASVSITPRFAFGFRSDVKDNLHYTDDGSILYPVGHNICIQSVDGRTQRLIPGTVDSEGITAIALSHNKKLLAVAERADRAIITIYDMATLKKKKVLTTTESELKEYVCISFSFDSKTVVAQGAGPEWMMLVWLWEKSKVGTSIRSSNPQGSPVYHCACSPGESDFITVIGQGIYKIFRMSEGSLKQMPFSLARRESMNYLCHTWMRAEGEGEKERQLVGTEDGDIIFMEGSELKGTFSSDSGAAIEALGAWSKGFIVAEGGGVITMFERDEKEYFRRHKSFKFHDATARVSSIVMSPADDTLVISLVGGQAYSIPVSSNANETGVMEATFEPLGGAACHAAGVSGMDVATRKPWLVTCSIDKTVRVWNYLDRSVELAKTFREEAYSVAIHPGGLMLLVGFEDKLRLMSIVLDDLRLVRELPVKACRDCCFSTGGQYFAAINGNTIAVYNTYTLENVGNLRGHNGKVKSISWNLDDTKLISAGMDGAVYEWRLKDCKREKENVMKGCLYNCCAGSADGRLLFAAGSDRKLKEMEDVPGSGTQVTREYECGAILTNMLLRPGSGTLYSASDKGWVRCYKYPLTGDSVTYKVHNGSISRLRMTWDETFLFSCGDDGSIFVFEIKDKDAAAAAAAAAPGQEKVPFAEEILVTKVELEEKSSRISELEQQVTELTMQTEYQLRLKDLHLQEKTKELTEKFSIELEADKHKFELLLQEKNEQELEYEERLKQMEGRGQQQLATLDSQYQAKLMAEVERYQQLVHEKELLNERWDEQNSLLVESHERVIAELTDDYENKLSAKEAEIQALKSAAADMEREFEEIKRQLEEDADREIEDMKEKYEQRLQVERDASLRLKGENGIMRKKFMALQKDIESQKDEIKALFDHKKELYSTIGSLEKDIGGLKREVNEQDETIGEKERRIYDLKKKNQELEKFKFVLDYKIKELKKQIEPREQEIAEMKTTIRDMDGELERYHKNTTQLDLSVHGLKEKQVGLAQEVLSQREGKMDAERSLKEVLHDIAMVAQHWGEPKALKSQMKWLYHKYCQAQAASAPLKEDIEAEYNHQREYLEKTVDGLKRKLKKDSGMLRGDNLRILHENTALLKEVNELRRELKSLKVEKQKAILTGGSPARAGSLLPAGSLSLTERDSVDTRKEVEMQRELIARLRDELSHTTQRLVQLEGLGGGALRPVSRERLPPLELGSSATAVAVAIASAAARAPTPPEASLDDEMQPAAEEIDAGGD